MIPGHGRFGRAAARCVRSLISTDDITASDLAITQIEGGAELRAPSAIDPNENIGRVLGGQYRIDELIGEGGMGIVYRAHQLNVDRSVAIKLLRHELAGDQLAVRRFENEAKVISRLRHPNTLRLYDCQKTEDGDLFLVTELLAGTPLSAILASQGRLSLDRAARIVDQIARSLSEAHGAGIIHRDIKPENVIIDRIGTEEVVKVLDFSIAKILQAKTVITRRGAVNGTPLFMSPEQALGKEIDPRADIYALGAMFYTMLTGKPPFSGKTVVEILRRHIHENPTPISTLVPDLHIPPDVDALIRSMMAKRPEDRPASVDDIPPRLAAITGFVTAPRPLSSSLSGTRGTTAAGRGELAAYAWAALAIVLGIAALAIGVLIAGGPSGPAVVVAPPPEEPFEAPVQKIEAPTPEVKPPPKAQSQPPSKRARDKDAPLKVEF